MVWVLRSFIKSKDADDVLFSTVFYFSIVFSCAIYVLLDMLILRPVVRILTVRISTMDTNSVQQAFMFRKMIFKKFFDADWNSYFCCCGNYYGVLWGYSMETCLLTFDQ